MRFSIRDLVWATLVVAMGLGWWVSHRAIDNKRFEAVGQTHRFRAALVDAKQSSNRLYGIFHGYERPGRYQPVAPGDWRHLIVEP